MEVEKLSLLEKAVYDQLEQVIDPELGVSLIDLGLIYEIEVDQTGNCEIKWSLTTMGCPIIDLLDRMIKEAALKVDGIKDCQAKLVYYPQWTPEMMSRVARITLGIHL